MNLKRKQKHTAKRIYDRLVSEIGFTGGESSVRIAVANLKDKRQKAFIPLSFEPAEAVQIDWGEAKVYIHNEKIKVYIFCMRLCYSSDIFVKAYFRQKKECFLDALLSGFEYFNGIPRKVIFDNAKVAVKEGFGAHAKATDHYQKFAAHHAFTPTFCNVNSGHEKGLVEGLVGWSRRNILVPIPRVNHIDEVNELLHHNCLNYRNHRIKSQHLTVGERFEVEKNKLTPLPTYRYDTSRTVIAKVDNFSTVKFDYNHYSVPALYTGKDVTVKGFGNEVIMFYQQSQIANYSRYYGRDETFYQLEHDIELIEERPRSVYNAKPVKASLSQDMLDIGERLSGPREMVKLLRLVIDYGEIQVIEAVKPLNKTELTVDQIRGLLLEPSLSPVQEYSVSNGSIEVKKPNLNSYDQLLINANHEIIKLYAKQFSKAHFIELGLGLKACQAGFHVRFYTASNLVNELSEALQFNRLSKLEKSLSRVDLLIVDELSYLTFNRHQSELLFQIISERSERGSVIITTNLEFSKWTELFENEIMVAALIDRLTFRSHILDMNVDESYRYQETKKRFQQRAN